MSPEQRQEILNIALEWGVERACSVIPMLTSTKVPAKRWKWCQSRRPSQRQIYRWFGLDTGNEYGVAVLFGEISGYLASRDFDTVESYEAWKAAHPDLAEQCPTVATPRPGFQVFFKMIPGQMDELRRTHGFVKANGELMNGAIPLPDGSGELRAGSGCYSLLPPSPHPSGKNYRWLNAPDWFPILHPVDAGFISLPDLAQRGAEVIEGAQGDDYGSVGKVGKSTSYTESSPSGIEFNPRQTTARRCKPSTIEEAIEMTLPQAYGERRRKLLDFKRALEATPAGAGATPEAVRPLVQQWWERALPNVRTKAWQDTWADFLAMPAIKCPLGTEPIHDIVARAEALPPLPAAIALGYDGPVLRLVNLCRALQEEWAPEPFFLSSRKVEALLGIPARSAARYLTMLVADGLLESTCPGDFKTMRSSRYRFAGRPTAPATSPVPSPAGR